jgi:UDP-N-acetylmuramoyl-tripeptide--D-alanyl-D-alanine ligase
LPDLVDVIEALTGYRLDQKILERAAQLKEQRVGIYYSFSQAVIDSRQAVPSSLFIAIPGEHVDGHAFLDDAFSHGAIMALIQRDVNRDHDGEERIILDLRPPTRSDSLQELIDTLPVGKPVCLRVENTVSALQKLATYWMRKLNLVVIGVTGSVGKSSTKEIIGQVLSRRYSTFRNPGNLNNEIGLPLSVLSLTSSHQCAILEMGFFVPGEIKFLCEIARPTIGVVTNIGTVHASRAGSREAIAAGKAELVESLPPSPQGTAILNYDDPYVMGMAQKTRARIFTYGMDSRADLYADQVDSLGLDGLHFVLHYHQDHLHIRIPMIGRHSVQTALRATAVGLVLGLTWQEIIDGLQSATNQLRLVVTRSCSGAMILDDTYNASPESTLAALNLLSELAGKKIAVLGDMLELGPYERRGHALVGFRAAEVVDELVTVGERGKQIGLSAQMGGLAKERIVHLDSTEKAAEYLTEHLMQEHVVLIKGSRGMRMDRIVTALEENS